MNRKRKKENVPIIKNSVFEHRISKTTLSTEKQMLAN